MMTEVLLMELHGPKTSPSLTSHGRRYTINSRKFQMWFYIRELCPKGADRMATSVDPDLGLQCLPSPKT